MRTCVCVYNNEKTKAQISQEENGSSKIARAAILKLMLYVLDLSSCIVRFMIKKSVKRPPISSLHYKADLASTKRDRIREKAHVDDYTLLSTAYKLPPLYIAHNLPLSVIGCTSDKFLSAAH